VAAMALHTRLSSSEADAGLLDMEILLFVGMGVQLPLSENREPALAQGRRPKAPSLRELSPQGD